MLMQELGQGLCHADDVKNSCCVASDSGRQSCDTTRMLSGACSILVV